MNSAAVRAALGSVFYGAPEELTSQMIDPLLWPVVQAINRSGWVWTGESCQGHPDATEWEPWANNTRPMLRLATAENRLGDLLALLMRAGQETHKAIQAEAGWYYPGFTVWPGETKGGYTSVLVYIEAMTAHARNSGIRVYARLAELLGSPSGVSPERSAGSVGRADGGSTA